METPLCPESAPLVIVEGFLCGAGAVLWGNLHEDANAACRAGGRQDREIIFAPTGPVSSLHDRACELFYLLRGGIVDYGEEHSRTHGHSRFGRTHATGLYPEWSTRRPLHFLAHSLGGPTVVKMQRLLQSGFFGPDCRPDMVLSISAVSAPFRGTQLVYILGEDETKAPTVRPFSVGTALAKCVHVLSYLAPILPNVLDTHAEARALSFAESSVVTTLKRLWRSDWAESEDAAPFDVTFQAAQTRETQMEGVAYPDTYYRSYVACMVEAEDDGQSPRTPLRHLLYAPLLYFSSRAMRSFDYSSLTLGISNSRAKPDDRESQAATCGVTAASQSAYWANDGVVPVFSQWHPFNCSDTECVHSTYPLTDDRGAGARWPTLLEDPRSGVWHVHHIEGAHHVSIVPLWMGTAKQKAFWRDLGAWLCAIDAKRGPSGRSP